MIIRQTTLAVLIAIGSAGCSASNNQSNVAPAASCPLPGQSPMLIARLYFGLNRHGRPITAKQWTSFLQNTVTANFPGGFTVYDANGQWMDPATHSISRDPTKVVEIGTEDTQAVRDRIETVSLIYRHDFDQKSVGVITLPGCAAF